MIRTRTYRTGTYRTGSFRTSTIECLLGNLTWDYRTGTYRTGTICISIGDFCHCSKKRYLESANHPDPLSLSSIFAGLNSRKE